eukprot:554889-Hanusia_phi.AAC.17
MACVEFETWEKTLCTPPLITVDTRLPTRYPRVSIVIGSEVRDGEEKLPIKESGRNCEETPPMV